MRSWASGRGLERGRCGRPVTVTTGPAVSQAESYAVTWVPSVTQI